MSTKRTFSVESLRLVMGYRVLFTVLAFASSPASALVIGDIDVLPAQPTTADSVSVAFVTGPCLFIFDAPDSADINMTGTAMEVVIDGSIETNPTFCNGAVGPVTFTLGRMPVGVTSVRLIIREVLPPYFVHPPFASLNVNVLAAPVPTTNVLALLAGAVLILMLVRGVLMRESESCGTTSSPRSLPRAS